MFGITLDTRTIQHLKDTYKPGTRIRLIHMNDSQAPMDGAEGSVVHVDDIGTIHMRWDNGSSLGLVYGEDSFEIVR